MELRSAVILIWVALFLASCDQEKFSDAYGQFEANQVTISAETPGILKHFTAKEGMQLLVDEEVGQVDTTQLFLRKKELRASMNLVRTNIDKLEAESAVFKEQLTTAKKDLNRLTNLKESNAATQQQIDQAQGQVKVLEKKIAYVEVQKQSVSAELEIMKVRIAQVDDQIHKARIMNPVEGVILSVFVEPGELVSSGKPLYKIADLSQMELQVYISGAQLPSVKLGQQVEVLIDKNAQENEVLSGEVSWIASEAEFTPRMIQTKEERVTQVYAVKIRVTNPEGKLKIGMPGEVNFR